MNTISTKIKNMIKRDLINDDGKTEEVCSIGEYNLQNFHHFPLHDLCNNRNNT